jgi:tetratricopeptide (TPR) repeat protein
MKARTLLVMAGWVCMLVGPGMSWAASPAPETTRTYTAADALAALLMSVGVQAVSMDADVDQDGAITSNDSRLMLRCVVGDCPPTPVPAQTGGDGCSMALRKAQQSVEQHLWRSAAAIVQNATHNGCAETLFADVVGQANQSLAQCQQRLQNISDGESLCAIKDWGGCVTLLASAMDGGASSCPEDADRFASAQAVLEQAQATLASAPAVTDCDALHKEVFAFGKQTTDQQVLIARYHEVLTMCPQNCKSMSNIGTAYYALKEYAESVEWFEKALACNPQSEKIKENLVKAQNRLHSASSGGASGSASSSRAQATDCAALRAQGGLKITNDNDYHGAIAIWKKALQHCPGNCELMLDVASAYNGIDELCGEGLRWIVRAQACDPGNADIASAYKMAAAVATNQCPPNALEAAQAAPALVPSSAKSAGSAASFSGPEKFILDMTSVAGVSNHPKSPTRFSISSPTLITKIWTYHYNDGKGDSPGTISLVDVGSGKIVGTWNVVGTFHMFDSAPGATWPKAGDGPPHLYWYSEPNVVIAPGQFEVRVSNPKSWAHNSESKGRGFAFVYGKTR